MAEPQSKEQPAHLAAKQPASAPLPAYMAVAGYSPPEYGGGAGYFERKGKGRTTLTVP